MNGALHNLGGRYAGKMYDNPPLAANGGVETQTEKGIKYRYSGN